MPEAWSDVPPACRITGNFLIALEPAAAVTAATRCYSGELAVTDEAGWRRERRRQLTDLVLDLGRTSAGAATVGAISPVPRYRCRACTDGAQSEQSRGQFL